MDQWRKGLDCIGEEGLMVLGTGLRWGRGINGVRDEEYMSSQYTVLLLTGLSAFSEIPTVIVHSIFFGIGASGG